MTKAKQVEERDGRARSEGGGACDDDDRSSGRIADEDEVKALASSAFGFPLKETFPFLFFLEHMKSSARHRIYKGALARRLDVGGTCADFWTVYNSYGLFFLVESNATFCSRAAADAAVCSKLRAGSWTVYHSYGLFFLV